MNTAEILALINNPEVFEINQLPRSSHKKTYDKDGNSLDFLLNGEWFINYVDDITNRDQNFMNGSAHGDRIEVPSNVELKGYGQIHYVNTQYPWDGVEKVEIGQAPQKVNYCTQLIKEFEYTRRDEKKYSLNFEGVESAFNIWLNGQYIGYSTDAYTTSEFDITDHLITGKNSIAIEIYKYTASSWLDDQDFWRLSGIIRDVYIREKTKEYIVDHRVDYELHGTSVEISLTVTGDYEYDPIVTITDPNGTDIYSGRVTEKIRLNNIKLWNYEEPNLYQFHFISPNEQFTQAIGFRKIDLIDETFYLNDEKIIFRGINRHEFSNKSGRALTKEDIRKDIQLIKEANFNAIRTSHYPNQPYFYELCDEVGLLVIDEVNLETHGTWFKAGGADESKGFLPGNNPKYEANVLKRAENLYQRDKNFTSVVMWSLGNESYGGETLGKMYEYFKYVDNRRYVHYEGVFWDRSVAILSDIESQMYITSENVEKWLNENPNKPYMLCEYSHAMGNSNANLLDYIELEKYKNYHGGFIWEFIDQALEVDGKMQYGGDFGDRPTDYNFICDGLVGPNREVTDELLYVTDLFAPIQITCSEEEVLIVNNHKYVDMTNVKLTTYNQDTTKSIKSIELAKDSQYSESINSNVTKVEVEYNGYTKVLEPNKMQSEFLKSKSSHFEFVDGNWNFGLKTDNMEILFSKNHHSLTSLKFKEQQIFKDVKSAFIPNFWRPYTNNEIGAGLHEQFSIWQMVSKYQVANLTNYNFDGECLRVKIEYKHMHMLDYLFVLEYEINRNEEIFVNYSFKQLKSNLPIQCIGLKAELDKSFNEFTYYGNGPYASYVDRKDKMQKGVYKVEVDEQNNYVYPQETSNRTDCERLNIYNSDVQVNFHFDRQIDFSVISNSDDDIENAKNRADLNNDTRQLKINSQNSGVAGDDSWGNKVKEKYQINTTTEQTLSFKIDFGNK